MPCGDIWQAAGCSVLETDWAWELQKEQSKGSKIGCPLPRGAREGEASREMETFFMV